MSYMPPGLINDFVKYRTDDLLREAERDRIADQLARAGRPVRIQLAERLRSLAEWVEGAPQLANA